MNDIAGDRVGPMLNPPHLGELIRESMDEMGWNVTETAERLGCKRGCERGTLSRLLNGKAACRRTWRWHWRISAGAPPITGCVCRRATSLRRRAGTGPTRNGAQAHCTRDPASRQRRGLSLRMASSVLPRMAKRKTCVCSRQSRAALRPRRLSPPSDSRCKLSRGRPPPNFLWVLELAALWGLLQPAPGARTGRKKRPGGQSTFDTVLRKPAERRERMAKLEGSAPEREVFRGQIAQLVVDEVILERDVDAARPGVSGDDHIVAAGRQDERLER